MPHHDAVERHRKVVRAPREVVYEAIRGLDVGRSPIIRALFALRGLPVLLSRSSARGGGSLGHTLDGLLRSGFVMLGERPKEELLLGLVGRFWTPSGGILQTDAGGFRAFRTPGYAKAAWDFRLSGEGETTLLTTETRVLCTDATSRRKFRLYWTVIGPFSGLVREEMLRAIKNTAEQAASAAGREPIEPTNRKVTT